MLKYLPLFFSNLRRKPLRLGLTFASIAVAFLLFGLLKTVQSTLSFGADYAGADRLITMHKVSMIQLLPRSYLNRIDAVEGVAAAASFTWFGGSYQDERNQFGVYATDPDRFFDVYYEYELPAEQRADWISDRASIIVGESLAERFDWHVGDRVPIRSNLFTKTDGNNTWEFRIAGIYSLGDGDNASAYFHYENFNESIGEANLVGFIGMRVDDPAELKDVAGRVDALFANSPAETKTDTESAFIQRFANQLGDIGAIVTAVVGAVFFTILLVTGNTMSQSVRERTNELAVLKTLGFSSPGVASLVLAESFAVTALGGVAGLTLSAVTAKRMASMLQQYFPVVGVPTSAYVTGAALIVVLGALAGLVPSLQAGRLGITEALRRA